MKAMVRCLTLSAGPLRPVEEAEIFKSCPACPGQRPQFHTDHHVPLSRHLLHDHPILVLCVKVPRKEVVFLHLTDGKTEASIISKSQSLNSNGLSIIATMWLYSRSLIMESIISIVPHCSAPGTCNMSKVPRCQGTETLSTEA